jgi:hypothetical protein
VVRTDLITDISVEHGVVSVEVDLSPDHQFAAAIEEDIREKVEPRWDVQDVHISFTRD